MNDKIKMYLKIIMWGWFTFEVATILLYITVAISESTSSSSPIFLYLDIEYLFEHALRAITFALVGTALHESKENRK